LPNISTSFIRSQACCRGTPPTAPAAARYAGAVHSGFSNLRSALPMNIKGHHPGFKVWAGAQADIDRITTIWRECLAASDGPYLFGAAPTVADAMYAQVLKLDSECSAYCAIIMAMPHVKEWVAAALTEPDEVHELDVEF
jgi:glutathione S-transferase